MKWRKFPLKKQFRSGTDGVVSHRLLLCVMKRRGKDNKFGRGPIEQCVEDICSVPRGGVRKKNNSVEDR